MTTSEQINEIAAALAKAQGEMGGAKKDAANPFFKSKYADLASVRDAINGPLSKHGIAVIQSPSAEGNLVSVVTLLAHSSGQWMRGEAKCVAKDDSPQSVGSATTYLRRYALQSFAGIAPEDDDAEAAQGRGAQPAKVQTMTPQAVPTMPKGYEDWLTDMSGVVDEGTERLTAAWKNSKAEYRQFLTSTNPKQWEAMKARAARHDSVPA
jgi:hypothetical protein